MSDTNGSCGCHVEKIGANEPENVERLDVVVLRVAGMGCVNCANRVHNGLVSADGVLSAQVDLTSATAIVRIDARRIRAESLLPLVVDAGRASRHRYEAEMVMALTPVKLRPGAGLGRILRD